MNIILLLNYARKLILILEIRFIIQNNKKKHRKKHKKKLKFIQKINFLEKFGKKQYFLNKLRFFYLKIKSLLLLELKSLQTG